ISTAAGIGFDAFPSAPEHKNLGAEFGPQVHGAQGLLHGIGAYFGVVGREGAVAENGVVKQIDGSHGEWDFVIGTRSPEFTNNSVSLGGLCVDRDEIVVVQVHSPGSNLPEQCNNIQRGDGGANRISKGVAPTVADSPESERKFVFRPRFVLVSAHKL